MCGKAPTLQIAVLRQSVEALHRNDLGMSIIPGCSVSGHLTQAPTLDQIIILPSPVSSVPSTNIGLQIELTPRIFPGPSIPTRCCKSTRASRHLKTDIKEIGRWKSDAVDRYIFHDKISPLPTHTHFVFRPTETYIWPPQPGKPPSPSLRSPSPRDHPVVGFNHQLEAGPSDETDTFVASRTGLRIFHTHLLHFSFFLRDLRELVEHLIAHRGKTVSFGGKQCRSIESGISGPGLFIYCRL